MVEEEILPIIKVTATAARLKLNKNNRKFCFEIFGYDFMVDEQLKPWLIEVNTNPCIEESSQLLVKLLPRMLDDALKITLDWIFPVPRDFMAQRLEQNSTTNPGFQVDGYPDEQNLWGEPFYQFTQFK